MLARFLPLLIFVAIAVSLLFAQLESSFILAILLAVWCACRLRDEQAIRILLKRHLSGERCSHHDVLQRPLLLSGLKSERDALLKQAISNSIETVQSHSLIRSQNPPQPPQDLQSAKFYERVLENLHRSTGADLTLVAIRQHGGLPPAVLATLPAEPGLAAVAAQSLAPILNGDSVCPSEPTLTNSSHLPFGPFARFGYKLALARTFREAYSAPPGVFLLLFRDSGRFGHHLMNELTNVTARLETELSPLRAIYELSSQVQQAESQNRLKSDVLASISHDMRSPLNNIRAIIHLLGTEKLSSEAAELLDVASSNCDSASEILGTVLDFISHQAGKLCAHRNSFNIAALLRDVVNAYRIAARLKGLELELILVGDSVSIFADHRQIRRVLSNVIGNAIKYTEHGKVTVELLMSHASSVIVKVRDSGAGMSDQQLSQLFTPFTRFNPKSGEGVGLGLALSRALLELNGANISVNSTLNVGSEVAIVFAASNANRQPNLDIAVKADKPALNLLLVDDDPDATATLCRALKVLSIESVCASTTRDALSLLTYQQFDGIISDASMPDGGAARIIEFINSRNNHIPLLILTGSSRESELKRLRLLGAAEILLKPANIEDIVAAIDRLVNSKNVERMRLTA